MKPKSLILMAVALGCGLVAMLGVQQALSGRSQPPEEVARVLMATTDIAPGAPLDESNTQFKEVPKAAVPEGAVVTPEQFKDRSLKVGAVPGEMIMQAKLGEPGVFGASGEIPEGMRVVTVPVDLTKSHSGLIRPGDRVDVLLSYSVRIPGFGEMKKVRTVLEYIKVFATDHLRVSDTKAGGGEIKSKNISLLVDPEQAKFLMMAESLGLLHLALRHKKDAEAVAGEAMTLDDFEEFGATRGAHDPLDPVPVQADAVLPEPPPAPDHHTVPTSVVPPPACWKIHIYAGSEHRVEDVTEPEYAVGEI